MSLNFQEAYLQIYESQDIGTEIQDTPETETLSEAKEKYEYRKNRHTGETEKVRVWSAADRARQAREQKKAENTRNKAEKIITNIQTDARGGMSLRQHRDKEEAAKKREEAAKKRKEPEKKPTVTTLTSQARRREAPPSLDDLLGSIRKETPKETPKEKTRKEEFSNYTIAYLLDEGYAKSIESAEVIMNCMSDEWLLDILEKFAVDFKDPKYHAEKEKDRKLALTGKISKAADELQAEINRIRSGKEPPAPVAKTRKVKTRKVRHPLYVDMSDPRTTGGRVGRR